MSAMSAIYWFSFTFSPLYKKDVRCNSLKNKRNETIKYCLILENVNNYRLTRNILIWQPSVPGTGDVKRPHRFRAGTAALKYIYLIKMDNI